MGRARLGNRLMMTGRATRALRSVVHDAGPQHMLLSWPGGTTLLPAALHEPGEHQVIVGHVASCPIYADLRQLQLFRDRRVVVDAADRPGLPPLFRVRPDGGSAAADSRKGHGHAREAR